MLKETNQTTINLSNYSSLYDILKDDIHIKHMDYMEIEELQKLYSERYKIEAKNAELKSNFCYDEANATGKVGITIQGATTLFLANMYIPSNIKTRLEFFKGYGIKKWSLL